MKFMAVIPPGKTGWQLCDLTGYTTYYQPPDGAQWGGPMFGDCTTEGVFHAEFGFWVNYPVTNEPFNGELNPHYQYLDPTQAYLGDEDGGPKKGTKIHDRASYWFNPATGHMEIYITGMCASGDLDCDLSDVSFAQAALHGGSFGPHIAKVIDFILNYKADNPGIPIDLYGHSLRAI